MEHDTRILLVDDTPTNLKVLFETLDGRGYELLVARSGEQALVIANEAKPHLILLDIMMPGIDGLETCARLKADDATRDTPVIFMSALSATEDTVRGLDGGAVDYITKPFHAAEVIARVETHLTIHRLRSELTCRNADLQAANQRMKKDLAAAARIQQSLLPTESPSFRGARFAWHYAPCDELAGDLLDIIPVDDEHTIVYVADVTGHGVPASLLSVSMHRSLSLHPTQDSVIAKRDEGSGALRVVGPAEVAQQLNGIYPIESNGWLFSTMVYGVLHLPSGRFDYVCAGHPGPIHVRPGAEPLILTEGALPLGVSNTCEYRTSTVALRPGDRIYLFTDGLLEPRDADGEIFGAERLLAAVGSARDQALERSLESIVGAATDWCRDSKLDDDATIVGLHICAFDK